MFPALIVSAILVLIHLYGRRFTSHLRRHKDRIVSFGSGITIAYLFLWLLPELYKGSPELGRVLFSFVLLGFSLFHIAEKYFYQHDKSLGDLRHDLKELHSLAFFIYYILIGLLLFDLIESGVKSLILFSIPVIIQSAVSSTSIEKIHEKVKEKAWLKAYLASAPILGLALGRFVDFGKQFFDMSLGFVVGMLFYTFISDHIPKGREGKIGYFILGVGLYALLIFLIDWV